ncbi:MAG: GTP cyclohydrolase, FolE2/MptA family, partial [Bacilli bacterium]
GMELSVTSFKDFAVELQGRLKQADATIDASFPWFYERRGPLSEIAGLNHAKCGIEVVYHSDGTFDTRVRLEVAVTTLCPCSKEISEYSAHNQRGYIRIEALLHPSFAEERDWKVDFLEACESNASARIHPVLKRPDEKYVTEYAYENPRFVEDMVRLVASDLYEMDYVVAFTVECKNEESIHLHDAVAKIHYDKRAE